MKESDECPWCGYMVEFVFDSDYYMTPEGEEADTCECPNCGRLCSMSWHLTHSYSFTKKEDSEAGR